MKTFENKDFYIPKYIFDFSKYENFTSTHLKVFLLLCNDVRFHTNEIGFGLSSNIKRFIGMNGSNAENRNKIEKILYDIYELKLIDESLSICNKKEKFIVFNGMPKFSNMRQLFLMSIFGWHKKYKNDIIIKGELFENIFKDKINENFNRTNSQIINIIKKEYNIDFKGFTVKQEGKKYIFKPTSNFDVIRNKIINYRHKEEL